MTARAGGGKAWRWALLVAGVAVCAPSPGHAQSDLEWKVKAAFLYNFAKFVTWPADKFASTQSPIEICVLEPDPFGATLDETVHGKSVDGRPLVVRRASRIDSLRSCHLLYADGAGEERLAQMFSQLAPHAVMTVHSGGVALSGGVARFFLEDRRVRFEINAAAAERAGLQLSAKLQSVAVVVRL